MPARLRGLYDSDRYLPAVPRILWTWTWTPSNSTLCLVDSAPHELYQFQKEEWMEFGKRRTRTLRLERIPLPPLIIYSSICSFLCLLIFPNCSSVCLVDNYEYIWIHMNKYVDIRDVQVILKPAPTQSIMRANSPICWNMCWSTTRGQPDLHKNTMHHMSIRPINETEGQTESSRCPWCWFSCWEHRGPKQSCFSFHFSSLSPRSQREDLD